MEEREERVDTYRAIEEAVKAFEDSLKGNGYDYSYWAIRITAWILATDSFEPLEKIELDTRGQATGEYVE